MRFCSKETIRIFDNFNLEGFMKLSFQSLMVIQSNTNGISWNGNISATNGTFFCETFEIYSTVALNCVPCNVIGNLGQKVSLLTAARAAKKA